MADAKSADKPAAHEKSTAEKSSVKLSKEDHALLKRALETHERVTGEPASKLAGMVAEADEPEDAKAKAEAAKKAYDAQAKLNAKVEEAHQAERKARAAADAPADKENSKHKEPAAATT